MITALYRFRSKVFQCVCVTPKSMSKRAGRPLVEGEPEHEGGGGDKKKPQHTRKQVRVPNNEVSDGTREVNGGRGRLVVGCGLRGGRLRQANGPSSDSQSHRVGVVWPRPSFKTPRFITAATAAKRAFNGFQAPAMYALTRS